MEHKTNETATRIIYTPCKKWWICRSCAEARARLWSARLNRAILELDRRYFRSQQYCYLLTLTLDPKLGPRYGRPGQLHASTELKRFTARLYRLTTQRGARQLIKIRAFEKHLSGAYHIHVALVLNRYITTFSLAECWQAGHATARLIPATDTSRVFHYVAKYVLKDVNSHSHTSRMRQLSLSGSCIERKRKRERNYNLLSVERISAWTPTIPTRLFSGFQSSWSVARSAVESLYCGSPYYYVKSPAGLTRLANLYGRAP